MDVENVAKTIYFQQEGVPEIGETDGSGYPIINVIKSKEESGDINDGDILAVYKFTGFVKVKCPAVVLEPYKTKPKTVKAKAKKKHTPCTTF